MVVHCKKSKFDQYIGRPGPWGNPFQMTSEADRPRVIEQFEAWGRDQPWLRDAARRELAGKTLGCWCSPRPCHGDVLKAWASDPNPQWTFVFGSNRAGRHGKGAALEAVNAHGAEYGVGSGLTGNAYALPTKDEQLRTLPIDEIREEAERLTAFAAQNPERHFMLTRVGCGLAGYRDEEIAPLFVSAPSNIHLPGRWRQLLDPTETARIVVCGSRSFEDEKRAEAILERASERFEGNMEIVSGGARGADTLGEDFAVASGIRFVRFPPLWNSLGKRAGMARNLTMLWYGTHVIAFWDGKSRGTKGTIDAAKAEGIPVWIPGPG
jgi:hypothetical protein